MDKKKILKIIAENIRAERARRHFSQEYLAEKAGISTEYINRIEREKCNPTIVVIVNIARVLGVDLNSLFKEN